MIRRKLIDTRTVRIFFNKNWIQENELKIEESSKEELKLKDESTKLLKRIIQEKLQTINDETKKTY